MIGTNALQDKEDMIPELATVHKVQGNKVSGRRNLLQLQSFLEESAKERLFLVDNNAPYNTEKNQKINKIQSCKMFLHYSPDHTRYHKAELGSNLRRHCMRHHLDKKLLKGTDKASKDQYPMDPKF
jgi:hypothetical protein